MIARLKALRHDWRFSLILLTTVVLFEMTAFTHMMRFLPLFLLEELNIPEADIPRLAGLVAAAAMLTGVPLSPFWGPLADRYSRKWLILRVVFTEMMSYGLVALSGDLWMLIVARLVYGTTHGGVPLIMAAQSLVTPQAKLGMAMGVMQATFPLSASVGPPLGTILIKTVGLRGLFVFDFALLTVAALLLMVLMVEPPGRDTSVSLGKQLRQLFAMAVEVPTIRWSLILHFFMASGMWGLDPFVAIAIQRANATSTWGWDDPTAIGITLGVNGLITAAMTPLLGRLTDWLGAARLMMLAAPIAALCAFSLSVVQGLPAVWGLLLLLAIPQMAAMAAFFAFLGSQATQSQRAGVIGLVALPRNSAYLVGPAAGAMATGLGFGAVFVVVGGFWAVSTITALHLQRLAPASGRADPATVPGSS